jgi:hypothetical protein
MPHWISQGQRRGILSGVSESPSPVELLVEHVQALEPGSLPSGAVYELLFDAWPSLTGQGMTKGQADRLTQLQDVEWIPPRLLFVLPSPPEPGRQRWLFDVEARALSQVGAPFAAPPAS